MNISTITDLHLSGVDFQNISDNLAQIRGVRNFSEFTRLLESLHPSAYKPTKYMTQVSVASPGDIVLYRILVESSFSWPALGEELMLQG